MDILQLLRRIPKRCQVNVTEFDGRFKWRAYCSGFVKLLNVNENWHKYSKISKYLCNHNMCACKRININDILHKILYEKMYIFSVENVYIPDLRFIGYVIYDMYNNCISISYDFIKFVRNELQINTYGLNLLTNYMYCIIRPKNTKQYTMPLNNYSKCELNVKYFAIPQYFMCRINTNNNLHVTSFAM